MMPMLIYCQPSHDTALLFRQLLSLSEMLLMTADAS